MAASAVCVKASCRVEKLPCASSIRSDRGQGGERDRGAAEDRSEARPVIVVAVDVMSAVWCQVVRRCDVTVSELPFVFVGCLSIKGARGPGA
jgi:hypothetical protein